jgi:uncharacterized protein (TIGR02996 family)
VADILAIVSKAVFEKAAGKQPKVGTKLGMDRYVSAAKALEPLAGGGKLYLVTVRPPDEQLWLVGVLEKPKSDGKQWVAKACATPITDISALRDKLKFETGKGITAAKGALGMSLQTPRILSKGDVALLDASVGGGASGGGAKPAKSTGKGIEVPDEPPAKTTTASGDRDRRALLLDAVLADPESDLPRQVYADMLTQLGDPRGELIMLELALAGPLSIRKRDQLRARHAELVKANAKAWWPFKLGKQRRRGGFVESVTGTLQQINAAAGKLFATEPVTEAIVFVGDAAGVKKLVKAPWLERLRRLVVRGRIGDEGFATLLAAPAVASLRALNVTNCGLTGAALAQLGDKLPHARTLVLTSNPLKDKGIDGLLAWRHLSKIETLYLSACKLTSDGVTRLVAAPLFKLEKLTLSDNKIDENGALAIQGAAKNLPALRFLELKETDVETAPAIAGRVAM